MEILQSGGSSHKTSPHIRMSAAAVTMRLSENATRCHKLQPIATPDTSDLEWVLSARSGRSLIRPDFSIPAIGAAGTGSFLLPTRMTRTPRSDPLASSKQTNVAVSAASRDSNQGCAEVYTASQSATRF
jgi:hypothetical protein